MKSVLTLAFAAFALAGTPTIHSPANRNPLFKRSLENIDASQLLGRDFLTCQETYGGGSVTCGDSTSHDCYDPTQGSSCCLLDNGYCDQGDFCAPVAGFCCHNGEDHKTCASRLNFTLPSTFSDFPTSTHTQTSMSSMSTGFPDFTTSAIGSSADPNLSLLSSSSTSVPASTATIDIASAPSITDSSMTQLSMNSVVPAVSGTSAVDGAITRTGMQPDFTAPAGAQGKGNFTGAGAIGGPMNAPNGVNGQNGQNGATIIPFTGTGVSVRSNVLGFIGVAGVLVAGMVVV